MGATPIGEARRLTGRHVQDGAEHRNTRLATIVLAGAAIPLVAFALGIRGLDLALPLAAGLAAILVASRTLQPDLARRSRGAQSERKVGAILEEVGPGWHVLHDISLGRGDIDHVLVGTGGVFTIETKPHRGRFKVDNLDIGMFTQAYDGKKVLERVSGLEVLPLIVFSSAILVGPVPMYLRGATVLPARMLPGFLDRRRQIFSEAEAAEVAEALRLALEVDAAQPVAVAV